MRVPAKEVGVSHPKKKTRLGSRMATTQQLTVAVTIIDTPEFHVAGIGILSLPFHLRLHRGVGSSARHHRQK